MVRKVPVHAERSFGLSVGGVSCVLAAFFLWRGSLQSGIVLGAVGALLVAFALTHPRALKWPSMIWWRIAQVLAYVNARIILTVLFAVLLVPLGILWRIIGRDPLGRRRGNWAGWSPYPRRYRDGKHYARMF